MASSSCVEVKVLPTGYLFLPDRWIFADGHDTLKHLSPDYTFLVQHPSGRNLLFDLGMRKVCERSSLSTSLLGLGPGLGLALHVDSLNHY
jgi:hypothetical protein